MKFIWTDEYSVGVAAFDEQHQHFFELANKVYEILEKQDLNRVELENAVNDMANYALYHLSSEEDAFRECSYPRTEEHIKTHDMYREKIGELFNRTRVVEGQEMIPLTKEVVDFATSWLQTHILGADKQYASFFKDKVVGEKA